MNCQSLSRHDFCKNPKSNTDILENCKNVFTLFLDASPLMLSQVESDWDVRCIRHSARLIPNVAWIHIFFHEGSRCHTNITRTSDGEDYHNGCMYFIRHHIIIHRHPTQLIYAPLYRICKNKLFVSNQIYSDTQSPSCRGMLHRASTCTTRQLPTWTTFGTA